MPRIVFTPVEQKPVPGTGPDAPSTLPVDAPEPKPDAAAQPEAPRPFSDRRPGRGNRLRRGLRSRRKAFRQRDPRS
jgi:hypothetical protein